MALDSLHRLPVQFYKCPQQESQAKGTRISTRKLMFLSPLVIANYAAFFDGSWAEHAVPYILGLHTDHRLWDQLDKKGNGTVLPTQLTSKLKQSLP